MPDPTSLTTPSASTAPPAKKRQIDQRFIAPLLITAILFAGQLSFHILESYPRMLLSIGSSILAEIVLGLLYYKKIPHLASAYVTGISMGIILRTPEFWPFALCGIISILSKYVLRVHGRHLWNPSNFGISAILMLAPATVAALSVQLGNSVWAMVVIWVLGAAILGKLKRLHICVTYVASFLLFTLLRSAISHQPFSTEVAPITGPPYQLFIMFMITDPKSTVHPRWAQNMVAFIIAGVESLLRLSHNITLAGYPLLLDVHAPYYALFIVGPIANFVEIMTKARKGAPASSAAVRNSAATAR